MRCAVRCAIAAPRTFTKSSYVHSTSTSSLKPWPRSAPTSAQERSSKMPVSARAKRQRALVVLPSASARLRYRCLSGSRRAFMEVMLVRTRSGSAAPVLMVHTRALPCRLLGVAI